MSKKLKDAVFYSKSRILLDDISIENYVTTDNLLQNKQGKVNAEKMPKQTSNSVTRFEEGDILVANIRPYLKKIWLAKYFGGSSADVLTFKVNDNHHSNFIYYSMFRDEFFEHMMNGSKGTKMPRGDKNQILNFPIPDFNLQTQKAIAKVLSDLDAKIELNNKINAELEAMAKLLYDYWFVQFDFPCLPSDYRPHGQVNPNNNLTNAIKAVCTYTQVGGLPVPDGKKWFVYVIECIDGTFYKGMTNDLYRRYYEHKTEQGAEWTKVHKPKQVIHYEQFSSQEEAAKREKELKTGYGRTWLKREYDKLQKYGSVSKSGLPAHQTRLMTAGKMVYNEELKREIPEEWEVKKLNDLCSKIGDGIHGTPKYVEESEYKFINGNNLKNGFIQTNGDTKNVSKEEYEKYFIDLNDNSILLSINGTLGNLAVFTGEKVMLGKSSAYINCKSNYKSYCYQFLKQPHMPKLFWNTATGSTIKNLSLDSIKKLKIITPNKNTVEEFDKKIGALDKKIKIIFKENQKLSELRDWLLPMLMNGQVTVNNDE